MGEAIVENWFASLEKSYSIKKIKWLENKYEKCARLLSDFLMLNSMSV